MPPTRPYPSDLADEEWALLGPLLASPEKRDRPLKWTARRVADAVFYLLRSGCVWRMLPREYPSWQTVYCADPMIVFACRCAKPKDASATRARW